MRPITIRRFSTALRELYESRPTRALLENVWHPDAVYEVSHAIQFAAAQQPQTPSVKCRGFRQYAAQVLQFPSAQPFLLTRSYSGMRWSAWSLPTPSEPHPSAAQAVFTVGNRVDTCHVYERKPESDRVYADATVQESVHEQGKYVAFNLHSTQYRCADNFLRHHGRFGRARQDCTADGASGQGVAWGSTMAERQPVAAAGGNSVVMSDES
ncbi:hypothetical protein C8F01DRAFT_56682 [Mycena amicta]|nr:hypothetical protein C8F01DRAFT_56682 [Mycena amicta]